ncbi:MAG: A/G-specific adenine glycosylase [Chitinophagaceae bacterium]|nr:A/G-specific adenine glycosylase [Chitinophagaceae bacterium]
MHEPFFTKNLLIWNRESNKRQMPWKGEKDPYKIWISEIILQQTRVEQGWEYYKRFINEFPDIQTLASAPEQKVFKMWEGLGYYSRCRNLIAAAKELDTRFGGTFPDKYEDILSLKGVGEYTAAAIGSFAFGLPYAVIDGNVLRVISRFFGIMIPVDTTEGKKRFKDKAHLLLDKDAPGPYNQAIIDLGATVCRPVNPLCEICPLREKCVAFRKNLIDQLPAKAKKIEIKSRHFTYLIIRYQQKVYFRRRTTKDIWQGLYEPPLIESDRLLDEKDLRNHSGFKIFFKDKTFTVKAVSDTYRQKLTHRIVTARFIEIKCSKPLNNIAGAAPVSIEEMDSLSFPKIIRDYLNQKNKS